MSHVAVTLLCVVVGVAAIALVNTLDKTLDGMNTALATVNHPCAPGQCGTLADIDKAVVKSGDAIVTTQQQELAVTEQVRPVLDALAGIPSHVNGTMDSLTTTSNAASKSLTTLSEHLNPAIDTANSTIAKAGAAIDDLMPVEIDTVKLVKDFDARVTSPELDRFMRGAADSSQQFALTSVQITGIATDVHKQTTALVAPKPWYVKLGQYGTLGVNIACLATHSCPF